MADKKPPKPVKNAKTESKTTAADERSYEALALRFRPHKFADVIHQSGVVKTLQNAILKNRVGHAYIFAGPRGTGKTSLARIFAKTLNCLEGPCEEPCGKCEVCKEIADGSSMDYIEIDGASNRGIDQARDLREKVRYSPVKARYKIYVIDEVHMLTPEANNALLKTLEEPPEHVKFIFATTEFHKLMPTIVSRCQLFFFRTIPPHDIAMSLKKIVKAEKIQAEEESLHMIARNADGSLRDAQGILDQLVVYSDGQITTTDVIELLGLSDPEMVCAFAMASREGKIQDVIELVARLVEKGGNISIFLDDLLENYRNMLLVKSTKDYNRFVLLPESMLSRLEESAEAYDEERLMQALNLTGELREKLRYMPNQRIAMELLGIKLCRLDKMVTLRQLLSGHEPRAAAKEMRQTEKSDEENEGGLEDHDFGESVLAVDGIEELKEDDDNLSLETVQRKWEGFLESMKEKSEMKLRALLTAGHPSKLHGGQLVVSFDSSYHVDRLKSELFKEIINEALKVFFGVEIKFEAHINPKRREKEERKKAADAEMAARKKRAVKIKQAEQDPLVKKAMSVFKGKIVDVIDEER